MRNIVEYMERDLKILYDVYRYRTLTTGQVQNIYFSESTNRNYLYVRMHQLKKEKLIVSKPLIGNKGQKVTSCYFITEEGIALLERHGFLEGTSVIRAKDNRVDGAQ